jgi:hypothetical protein
MSDKADSLCEKMNEADLATSNETDNDASDSILDSEDDNNNRIEDYNVLRVSVETIVEEVNIDDPLMEREALSQEGDNIDDEHQQSKKNNEELLNWIITLVQPKKRKVFEHAFRLHLNGKSELPISMISM